MAPNAELMFADIVAAYQLILIEFSAMTSSAYHCCCFFSIVSFACLSDPPEASVTPLHNANPLICYQVANGNHAPTLLMHLTRPIGKNAGPIQNIVCVEFASVKRRDFNHLF